GPKGAEEANAPRAPARRGETGHRSRSGRNVRKGLGAVWRCGEAGNAGDDALLEDPEPEHRQEPLQAGLRRLPLYELSTLIYDRSYRVSLRARVSTPRGPVFSRKTKWHVGCSIDPAALEVHRGDGRNRCGSWNEWKCHRSRRGHESLPSRPRCASSSRRSREWDRKTLRSCC